MTDPLKILDKIECDGANLTGCVVWNPELVTKLRTALERQAEELEGYRKYREVQAEELAQARTSFGRIARIEGVLEAMIDVVSEFGLNGKPSDRLVAYSREVLNESEPQSVAALKARILREFSREKEAEAEEFRLDGLSRNANDALEVACQCSQEAYRLEREANESE